MSGRFDGKPSTIGNTSKYTPAHDCREGSLKMLRDLESRAGSVAPLPLGETPICGRSSATLSPMRCPHRFFFRIGSHAAVRSNGEHPQAPGRTASPNARAAWATFRVRARR